MQEMTTALPVVAGCLCGISTCLGSTDTEALKAGIVDTDRLSSLVHGDIPRPAAPLAREVKKGYSFPSTPSFPH